MGSSAVRTSCCCRYARAIVAIASAAGLCVCDYVRKCEGVSARAMEEREEEGARVVALRNRHTQQEMAFPFSCPAYRKS